MGASWGLAIIGASGHAGRVPFVGFKFIYMLEGRFMGNGSSSKSSTRLGLLSLAALTTGLSAIPTASAQSSAAAELAEIVVTARKREESLQEIPVAVTAFSAEQLSRRGIGELEDVALSTPGLAFEDYSSNLNAAPVMRGLTQVNLSSEIQNVSTFIDGVYVQRNYAIDFGLADISRIEVVKGPQSALYGQNAFGGAINYVMNRPGDEFAADAEVTVGTDGRLDYELTVGGPVIDGVLGLRAYYGHSEFDGTWRNEYPGLTASQARMGNRDNDSFSLLAAITPSESVDIELSYMRVERQVGNRAGWNISTGDAQNTGNCGPAVAPSTRLRYICGELPFSPQAFQTAASTRPRGAITLNIPTPGFVNETDFYRADINVELSDALSVVYQYGKVESAGQEISNPASNAVSPSFGPSLAALATGQFVPGFFNNVQKEGSTNDFDSHELRIDYAPQGSPLRATLGAYRSEFNDVYRFYLTSLPAGQFLLADPTRGFLDMTGFQFGLTDKTNIGRTSAIFGALSYAVTDRLTVGAEVRYSEEKKSVIDTRARVTLADTFEDVIPRFTVDYKLADDRLLYASVGQGLKTGGFNGVTAGSLTIPLDEQAFGPETNWTVEVGSKNTLMDGRLLLNVAAYNVDWTDLQIQALPSNAPANITNIPVIYRNLGNARSRGVEIEGLFAATSNLSINFGASFSDPVYKDGTISFRFANRCDGIVCPTSTAIGGKTLPRTPKMQLIAGVEWSTTLANGIEFFARGDATHQSSMQVEEMNIGQIEPRTLVNARFGFSKDNWSADLWGKNVFNEEYIANSFFIISGTGYSVALGERATYGMTLRYKF